jgi:hypothetical protein
MSALCGFAPAETLQGAPFDLAIGPAGKASGARRLAGTIRDLALIAIAWALFIGVIFHPGVQIVAIMTCALALMVGSARAPAAGGPRSN